MKIYFAGAVPPYSNRVIKHGGQALLSYADEKAILKFFKEHPHEKIFLDSGAFTAFTLGKQVNIEEYMKFIIKYREHIETYATLDVIGDWKGTVKNTDYMEAKGFHPLPVFHFGSPESELRRMIEKYDYIALGGLVPLAKDRPKLKKWLDYCFSIIGTKTRIHGLGMTAKWCLERYPFYTTDSTSYLQASRFGSSSTITNPKVLHYSNRSRHYLDRTEAEVLTIRQQEKNWTQLWKRRGVDWDNWEYKQGK